MSSSEEEYEYSDEDGYGSDEAEGEDEDEGAILVANTFYEADDAKTRSPTEAIAGFEKVVALEKGRGDEVKWRFKALEALVVLYVRQGNASMMVDRYTELLSLISHVTSNETLDAINSVLDAVSTSSLDVDALSKMYEVTLQALKAAKNERLWFSTNVRLGNLYIQTGNFDKLKALVNELHDSCKLEDGSDDPGKGTYLMEMYALEIQLCVETEDKSRVEEIYKNVQNLRAAINDPRIMGVINEAFGTMHMTQKEWRKAYEQFFDAFRSYSEAGNSQARNCLKYVVLANMLALEDIDPFDSQDAKVYKEDTEVSAMWRLRNSYTARNFDDFHRLLHDPRNNIAADPLIKKYIQPLVRSFRSVVILNTLKPYRHVSLKFLAQRVKSTEEEVEALLVSHILDGEINGSIDQVSGFLHLKTASKATAKATSAVGTWTRTLGELRTSLLGRLN